MSAVSAAVGSNGAPPSELWESHTARFVARWGRSGVVVAVSGELDAANAGDLAEHLQRFATQCEWLVVDLGDLEFIGTAGFSVLRALNTSCTNQGVHWTLVPGSAAAKLLRICDPDAALPARASVGVALAEVQGSPNLQLVARAR